LPPARTIDVEDAARLLPLGETGPVAVRFVPGRDALAYLRPQDDDTVQGLWLHPLDGAGPRLLLAGRAQAYTPAEVLRRERARITRDGVTSFQVADAPGGPVFVARTGDGFLRGGPDGGFAPWPGLDGCTLDDARLLAGGRRLVYAGEDEIGVADADGNRRVVAQAGEEGISVGLADYAAAEELGRQEGLWPSPDGRYLAYARVDARPVAPLPIVHGAEAVPWTERIRYPFAGGPNALVELWLAGLDPDAAGPGRLVEAIGPDRYLARVAWLPGGDLAALVYGRDQHAWTWTAYPTDGSAARVLAAASADHWLDLPAGFWFCADGTLLTTAEDDGHAHLVRYDAHGQATFLTRGDWDVTDLVDVDEGAGSALLQITAAAGLERHIVRVDLAGGRITTVVGTPGTHAALVAPDRARLVVQSSSRIHPTQTSVCDRDGLRLATVDADRGATAEALGLVPPRLVDLAADDGTTLHAALYLPPGEPRAGRAAVVSVYGGPHAQRVREEWGLTADLRAQYLAQQGLVVLKLDNRGSEGRGPAFSRRVEHAFATVELDDQVAGVRWLIEHEGVDASRVGIYGWSYGGFITLHALLRHPDVFCVGVSGAPVTDFRRYDTAYTERHLGTPASHPDAYARADVLPLAAALRGQLLVIHGLVDENVHFAHTARLLRAFIDAGRRFEVAVLPTSRHLPRDPATRRFVERRTVAWLVEHLAAPEPRA